MKVHTEIESEINEIYTKSNVTQKFTNNDEQPLELEIYAYKKRKLIFSSFSAQIGDSIKVKSKVIKKEKAEQKYSDSISSGNAAIFVSQDPLNENRIIIHMGNIPPHQEVVFISEFLHSTEASFKGYEFELFRNLPIFYGKSFIYQNAELKGKIQIKMQNKIYDIKKEILLSDLVINEEKYQNNEEKEYLISYEAKKLPELSKNDFIYSKKELSYIPCSKIYFNIKGEDDNPPIIYKQKSDINNENNYIFQCRNTEDNGKKI